MDGIRAVTIAAASIAATLAGAPAHGAGIDWAKAQPVTVVTTEYEFTPAHIRFERGVPYSLTVANHGKELHQFRAPEFFKTITMRSPDALNVDKTEIVVQPGQEKTIDFVAPVLGQYRLFCPDHDWAGMTGDITVK